MLEYRLSISGPSPIDSQSSEISYGYAGHLKELVPINNKNIEHFLSDRNGPSQQFE
ncbi:hypothetical protein YDYSY3_04040 [Paenibacillus chitinolyticus]|nr:hypothetical protein YDYSY3_04040 [Paenibacillus chitinolyticus]